MEAVAISIAKNALSSVVKTATTTIRNEIGLLLEVQEELFFIKEELEMMQAFLHAASMEKVKGMVVTTWIKQVQELAFDVEDCLQEASAHMMKKSCLHGLCTMEKHDHIVRKIRVLKTRIEYVSKRNQRYSLINKDNDGHTYDESASTISITNVEDLLVGLDEPKRNLVELIRKEHGEVISVFGMGGLGKTTLVRQVYCSQELRNEFKHFSWVTILHPFNTEEFIESLAKQIPSNSQEADNEDLTMEGKKTKSELFPKKTMKEKVNDFLKDNKYLIVLDDLSNVSEWYKIKDVLPPGNESRIIVTTRLRPLAESISNPSDNIYEIKELSEKDAFDLFCKAVYKTPNYRLVSDEGPSSIEILEKYSKVQKQCVTKTNTKEKKREMIDDIPQEIKCNMKNGPSSIERTEENSEVQKQCINITFTEEEDREMKDGSPHDSKCNMKNGPSSTEITEDNSKLKKQCITNTITEDMKTQAGLIIKSCGRLPLAIVTIGSYLATKSKTSTEWKTMHEHLSSELDNNPNLGIVKTVLTSSYDGMPYHLKPCLLYLSVFHNHKDIRRSRIIRQWSANGYVMECRKKTAEEVGRGHFNDLMGRSLIQPTQMSTIVNEDVKRCNIHDLMYELILAKAEDENIVSVLDENLITMTDKARHLVITGRPCTWDKVLERVKLSHMRSLSIFGEVGDYLRYNRMKLVRVLDLEGTLNLDNRDLRSVGKLHHLKYLGLRGTKITELPDSLGNLSELETLDIRNTAVNRLPTRITKLHKLSYLRAGFDRYNNPDIGPMGTAESILETTDYILEKCKTIITDRARDSTTIRKIVCFLPFLCFQCCYLSIERCFPLCLPHDIYWRNYNSYGVTAPRGIGELRSLNIIGMIDIGRSKGLAKEMQNLTNLRKLAVTGFSKDNGKTLAKVIDGLKHLRSLVLAATDDLGLQCCLGSVSSPPKYLQSLKLYSPLGELPDWISSLENLEKMHFRDTLLTEEVKAIEKLPNLKILYMSYNSFKSLNVLRFREGTFLQLQVMILEGINDLKSVSIEKTAFKGLEQLKISKCWSIGQNGVSGLEFLEQVKEIEVVVYSFSESNKLFVSNLQQKILPMLPKRPVLRVIGARYT